MSDMPLREQALKEGISAPGAPLTPPVDAKPADSSPATPAPTPTQAASPANTPAPTQEPPFHEHPRFKELTKRNQEISRKNQEYEKKLMMFEAQLQARTQQNQPQLNPEDSQALVKLFSMAKDHPEVSKMLGLDKIQAYEQSLEEMKNTQLQERFESDFQSVLEVAEKSGLDRSEVEQKLIDAFSEGGEFAGYQYQKGIANHAFRSLFFDQIGTMKEKEINRRLMEEQQKKKLANTENASGSQTAPQSGMRDGERMYDFLLRRAGEAGGIAR